jgi:hypothetical protein
MALVLVLMVASSVALVVARADRAAAAPLLCSSGLIYSTQSGSSLHVYNPDGTTATLATPGFTSNSIAFDPVDSNLYALAASTNVLDIVQSDGTVTSLGAVSGLPNTNYFAATFSPDGHLWLANTATIYEVDVSTSPPAVTASVKPSSQISGDFAWANGALYATNAKLKLTQIDPTTGSVTVSSAILQPGTFLEGAAFWYVAGHLFFNANAKVYEILGYDTSSPTTSLAATLASNPADGASCPNAPSPFIHAADDDFSANPVPHDQGGTVGHVFANDTVNGATATAATATATITDAGGATGAALASDGTLTVPAGIPAATYTLKYQLCETANTALCDAASVTFVVAPPDTVSLGDDDFTKPGLPQAGGTTPTVLSNDQINGKPIAPSKVSLSLTDLGGLTGATIGDDGTITVPAGSSPGTYTLTYQACETSDPPNCATATAKIRVLTPTATPTATATQSSSGSPSASPSSSTLPSSSGSPTSPASTRRPSHPTATATPSRAAGAGSHHATPSTGSGSHSAGHHAGRPHGHRLAYTGISGLRPMLLVADLCLILGVGLLAGGQPSKKQRS